MILNIEKSQHSYLFTDNSLARKVLKFIFWKLILASAGSNNEITFNSIF